MTCRRYFVTRTKWERAGAVAFGEIPGFEGGCGHRAKTLFIEDEPEDVVLVFVGLDLRAHLVGGFPDFGGELLFVHGGDLLWLVDARLAFGRGFASWLSVIDVEAEGVLVLDGVDVHVSPLHWPHTSSSLRM